MRSVIVLKALGCGLLTEMAATAATVGCILLGGWDVCGPASFWSTAGALLQLPGWYLELEVFRWGLHPGVPGPSWDLPIIFSMQALFWSSVWLLWLIRRTRRSRVTEPFTAPDGGSPKPLESSRVPEGPPR